MTKKEIDQKVFDYVYGELLYILSDIEDYTFSPTKVEQVVNDYSADWYDKYNIDSYSATYPKRLLTFEGIVSDLSIYIADRLCAHLFDDV